MSTLGFQVFGAECPPKHALDFKVETIQGETLDLEKHLGQVVLLVNVASKCGYTPQYEGLQKIQDKYSKEGFTVIGFPCNNFGAQEPGSASEILQFCQSTYDVKFPLMAKIDVKGDTQAPIYKYLTQHPDHGGDIKWNFEKFLINRKGEVIGHYPSKVKPESKELTDTIEKALKN